MLTALFNSSMSTGVGGGIHSNSPLRSQLCLSSPSKDLSLPSIIYSPCLANGSRVSSQSVVLLSCPFRFFFFRFCFVLFLFLVFINARRKEETVQLVHLSSIYGANGKHMLQPHSWLCTSPNAQTETEMVRETRQYSPTQSL